MGRLVRVLETLVQVLKPPEGGVGRLVRVLETLVRVLGALVRVLEALVRVLKTIVRVLGALVRLVIRLSPRLGPRETRASGTHLEKRGTGSLR